MGYRPLGVSKFVRYSGLKILRIIYDYDIDIDFYLLIMFLIEF